MYNRFSGKPFDQSVSHGLQSLQPFRLSEDRDQHLSLLIADIRAPRGTPSSRSLQLLADLLCRIDFQYAAKDGSTRSKKLRESAENVLGIHGHQPATHTDQAIMFVVVTNVHSILTWHLVSLGMALGLQPQEEWSGNTA